MRGAHGALAPGSRRAFRGEWTTGFRVVGCARLSACSPSAHASSVLQSSYWTANEVWPPSSAPDLGLTWPAIGLGLVLLGWVATLIAKKANRSDFALGFYAVLGVAVLSSVTGTMLLLWLPSSVGLDPTTHCHSAMVWLLLIWLAFHVGVGVLMQLYCAARRLAGKMDARHEADIVNVSLYWHFAGMTALIVVAVVAGFPELVSP